MHTMQTCTGQWKKTFPSLQPIRRSSNFPFYTVFLSFILLLLLPSTRSTTLQRDGHNDDHDCNLQRNQDEFEDCSHIRIPKMLVQYGPARTATTLQFQILCAIAVLLRKDLDRETVHCNYKLSDAVLSMYMSTNNRTRIVAKEHTIGRALDQVRAAQKGGAFGSDGAWLFATSTRNASFTLPSVPSSQQQQQQQLVLSDGTSSQEIKYEQNYNRVLKFGSRLAKMDYAPLFGLSSSEGEDLATYIHYWDILRLCCGSQMSKGYRAVLWWEGETAARGSHDGFINQRQGSEDRIVPKHKCEEYDIPGVEVRLVNSQIFQRGYDVQRLSRASLRDGQFTGNYCKCANTMISEKRLPHNSMMRDAAAHCYTALGAPA